MHNTLQGQDMHGVEDTLKCTESNSHVVLDEKKFLLEIH